MKMDSALLKNSVTSTAKMKEGAPRKFSEKQKLALEDVLQTISTTLGSR
jgi:hypothetical protein